MLGNVISLYRQGEALDGQLRCLDAELPVASSSQSLVYSLFMLESSPAPDALMHEIARVLKPEGVALLISLNPMGLARLRWLLQPTRGFAGLAVERLARDAGLEVSRRQYLGPFWPGEGSAITDIGGNRWQDRFRAANLVVLRRREAGLTPLRKASAAVSLRPGMSAG